MPSLKTPGLGINATDGPSTFSAVTVQTLTATSGITSSVIDTQAGLVSLAFLEDRLTNATSAIAVNFNGYAGGTTQFRNFAVYDGKHNKLLELTGSTGVLLLTGSIDTHSASNAYQINGVPVLSVDGNGVIDIGTGSTAVKGYYAAPYAAGATVNGTFMVDSATPGQFVFYAGGVRYKVVGTSF
jgi:hypothetical protein